MIRSLGTRRSASTAAMPAAGRDGLFSQPPRWDAGLRRAFGAASAALLIGGCATVPSTTPSADDAGAKKTIEPVALGSKQAAAVVTPATPAGANGAPPPLAGSSAAPARPDTGPLKPFADVIKEAKETKGFLTAWQKDEKVWLEVRPEQLDQPMFYSAARTAGLGERFLLPGLMADSQIVVLHRFGNQTQLIARNLRLRASAGSPLERAVRESYSDSLLASAPVVSTPHPDTKAFLIDANALFGGDLTGAQTQLEAAFRLPYALDARNSSIERVRAAANGTSITVKNHYAVNKLPAPPLTPPTGPQVQPPATLPDSRSLFLSYVYELAPLPPPMPARAADQRVGYFDEAFLDLTVDTGMDTRSHVINRWRLQKRDPNAAVSDPVEQIVAWLDKSIPDKYREPVRAGLLEWNKAFERAGISNAIDVRVQPDDADWNTLEGTRHIAVRWFAMEGPGATAVGPSQADPRTGEILHAAVLIPENWARFSRSNAAEVVPFLPPAAPTGRVRDALCNYAADALAEAEFGFELLAERGDIDPTGPAAERFVRDSLKDVVMHEMGHALGLRHNFKASLGVNAAQLRDAAFVRANGVSRSVMDYNPVNIPLQNEGPTEYNMVTLGAYDYWAIDYGYREFPAAEATTGPARVAAQAASDPSLAFGTDEDFGFGGLQGLDPTINQFDQGDDPLNFYRRRFALSRELWDRTQKRELKPGETYAVYRRNLLRGLAQIARITPLVSKYVGGVLTNRDVAGGSRPLFTPVAATKQRDALDLLARELFSSDSFRFEPRFMSRLGVDHLDRGLDNDIQGAINIDFSLASRVLQIQRGTLDQLFSDTTAARLADAESKVGDRSQLLSLNDLHGRLTDAIWSELPRGNDIDSLRRNLQREHLRRLAGGLVRPVPAVAADAKAVERSVASKLEGELKRAVARGGWNPTVRAHLEESLATLSEALRASLIKAGV